MSEENIKEINSDEEYKPDINEEEQIPKWKTVSVYDINGDLVSEYTGSARKKNGSGFVLSYTAKMCEFLEKVDKGSIVRVFVYIAHHQQYGVDGVFGYRTTRTYLAKALNINRKTLYEALDYLKDNFLVNELRINGSLEFMVNPAYVTMGTDRKSRDKEWNQRWDFYWKKIHKKNFSLS